MTTASLFDAGPCRQVSNQPAQRGRLTSHVRYGASRVAATLRCSETSPSGSASQMLERLLLSRRHLPRFDLPSPP